LSDFRYAGGALVIVAFLILPLIWSFSAEMQVSYWSVLIALDVWVLAVCLFWYVREAFLPPATIEELEVLIDGPVNSRTGKPPTKRQRPWELAVGTITLTTNGILLSRQSSR
jgi:hypothetical protein